MGNETSQPSRLYAYIPVMNDSTTYCSLQTAADRAANDIILGSLMRAVPDLMVIGEEGKKLYIC